MTKVLICIILLCSNNAISKQTYEQAQELLFAQLGTTKEKIEQESKDWENGFNQFLLDDEDPNIKVIGYDKKLTHLYKNDSINVIETASELNALITSELLDHKSISSIAEMCNDEKLKPHCHQDVIYDKMLQSMPNNANTYLHALNIAYQDKNQDGILHTIKDMAESTYIDVFGYSHHGFIPKLEEFAQSNRFSNNKLAHEAFHLNRWPNRSKNRNRHNSEHIQEIVILLKIINNKLTQPIPMMRNFIEACKNNTTFENYCLKIAETFIHKSKSIISAQIGYAIKSEIAKQNGQLQQQKNIENSKNQYTKRYECLSRIMHYGSTNLSPYGLEFIKIADPIERELGEVAMFETLAQLNFEHYTKLGNKKIKNPISCDNPIVN